MCNINPKKMESVANICGNIDLVTSSPSESAIEFNSDGDRVIHKYVEVENNFMDYLKVLMLESFNVNIDMKVSETLPEYDGSELGLEAIDTLCDLLDSYCDPIADNDITESSFEIVDKAKKNKTLKCPSTSQLLVKSNRVRSHSSVGFGDENSIHAQDLIDLNTIAETGRKSRRVSLGMRPRFSNWSRVKGAFKRDKSSSRLDSRDEYHDNSCSGDDISGEKMDINYSSSHEQYVNVMTSSDEEFEFYQEPGIDDKNENYENQNNNSNPMDCLQKSKSAIVQIHKASSPPNNSSSSHKNPFKWYRTKSIVPPTNFRDSENGTDATSNPPSPFKNQEFLYDDESILKVTDGYISAGNSGNEAVPLTVTSSGEVMNEVHNKYVSLQKRLSREFYDKYHDWRKGKDRSNHEDETALHFDESKLSPILMDQTLSPRFKQKFQEWQKKKGLPSLSPTRSKRDNFNPLKKSKTDWHKLISKNNGDNPDIDDMTSGNAGSPLCKRQPIDLFKSKMSQPGVEKKELAWLEKELQKVAREKQRLEKEKEKYAERETRLKNMKRAIKSGNRNKKKEEVLVPTSTGLIRFQGISSKFTRKLYEWEKAKGISAESSTFALLDSYLGNENSNLQGLDQTALTALLSRSRSVGSVEVAGVGSSLLQSCSVNHQQSSLSLNDMEQLEEAHLQVDETENLMQSASQLYDKENDKSFDFIIPNYSDSTSNIPNIPISSYSINSFSDKYSNMNELCSSIYSKQSNESGPISECYCSNSQLQPPGPTDTGTELVSSMVKQQESTNADVRGIVDEIKKLRATTSVEDEDRINILTNLEQLADQLVDMVHNLGTRKGENHDELAVQIGDLAIKLKKKIKLLTSGELQQSSHTNTYANNSEEVFISDVEDIESPTVHCTFTLPSWRVKHTTPSSTESESYSKRENRKHFSDDPSSGNDENYDGSDETTLHLDLKNVKNKSRHESSDNVSTSNSESLIHSESREIPKRLVGVDANEPFDVMHCILSVDSENLEKKVRERRMSLSKPSLLKRMSEEERESSLEHENDELFAKLEGRSYSPKPTSTKRKCINCGKVKRTSKSRKVSSSSYCCCRKENVKLEKNQRSNEKNVCLFEDEPSAKCTLPSTAPSKMGKISRSKVYDFNALKQSCENISTSSLSQQLRVSKQDLSNLDKGHVNVIVPTTRKIFAPLSQNENGAASAVVSYTIDDPSELTNGRDTKFDTKLENYTSSKCCNPAILNMQSSDKLPPTSPMASKRTVNKDSSNSSIKMMIAHYNKLTSENPDKKPIDSSCWISTVQKSPVMERKHKFENLSEVLCSSSGLRKSKSANLCGKSQQLCDIVTSNIEIDDDGEDEDDDDDDDSVAGLDHKQLIHKSSSVGTISLSSPTLVKPLLKRPNELPVKKILPFETNIDNSSPVGGHYFVQTGLTPPELERNKSFESVLSEAKLRSLRLQEAKNRFFNDYYSQQSSKEHESDEVCTESALTPTSDVNSYLGSTLEDDDGSICNLNKSVSTSAISYRKEACSSPVTTEKTSGKSSRFGFSSIASKFRKVKMRRHKDSESSAVSSLCRASLTMNLQDKEDNDRRVRTKRNSSSKSCPSSPVLHRHISKRNSSSN